MAKGEAEKRLGVRMRQVEVVSVEDMMREAKVTIGEDANLNVKGKIYELMVDYLIVEGFPDEDNVDFKEGNVNDLVYVTISPVIADYIRTTGRSNMLLLRQKQPISQNNEINGKEEFMVVDQISVTEEKYVLIVEAKRTSLGEAMKQVMLAMKDARDHNREGVVYGFVTTGDRWRMLTYDGTLFKKTNAISVLFDTMGKENEVWVKHYSVIVDCLYVALSS